MICKKKARNFFLAVILQLLFFSCASIANINFSHDTIVVPDDYQNIHKAIEAARNGDTIFIRNGTYTGNIVINKIISIIGESPEGVIIVPSDDNNKYGITFDIDYRLGLFETDLSKQKISSIQIRNFQTGIHIAYSNFGLIENCIIVPIPNSDNGNTHSLWIQGSNTTVEHCTLIGTVILPYSKVTLRNNIIVKQNEIFRKDDHFYYDIYDSAIEDLFEEETSEMLGISENTIENNIIWGKINTVGIGANRFSDPLFANILEYNFVSPFSKDGYGAKISGEKRIPFENDTKGPEIDIKDNYTIGDLNIVSKQDVIINLVIRDKNPISKIIFGSEIIDCNNDFNFERQSYKKEFSRSVILQHGYNTISIKAFDYENNGSQVDITFLYGDLNTIPKADWNSVEVKSEDSIEKYKNKIALVIGINDYPRELPKLKYAENDAIAVNALLQDLGYITLKPLLSPTLNEIKKSLIELEKEETQYDKVVIYFSGHGSNQSSKFSYNSGLLLPSDVDIENLSLTSFPMEDLHAFIKNLDAKSVVILLDMCFAGGGKGFGNLPKEADNEYITKVLEDSGKGKILLASSGDIEQSFEEDSFKHGVFTYFLLEAVKKNKRSIDAIYDYIYTSIVNSGKWTQRPRKVFLSDDVEGIHLLF